MTKTRKGADADCDYKASALRDVIGDRALAELGVSCDSKQTQAGTRTKALASDVGTAFVEAFKEAFDDQQGDTTTKALAREVVRQLIERERVENNGLRKLHFNPLTRTKANTGQRVIADYEKPAPEGVDGRTLEMWRRWAPALYDGDFLSVLQVVVGDEFDPDEFVEDCARAFVDLDTQGHLGLTRDRVDQQVLALINDKPLLQLKKSRRDGNDGTSGAPASAWPWLSNPGRARGNRLRSSTLI